LLRGFLLRAIVVLLLMLFVVGVPVRVFAVAGVDEARVIACYGAVVEAEGAGGNVTELAGVLDEAGVLLSRARAAFERVEFFSLTLNGVLLNLTDCTATWDSGRNEFMGNLFFEAWIYNATVGDFQYHERFVSLRLNMTI
jgi:hypothetical protein